MNSKENPSDFIVVGSGLTGAMSAETLVNSGASVLMLDVAYKNESSTTFPDGDFLSIRKNSTTQRELFLGENFEGIPWGIIKTGAQLTPGRKHIVKDLERWLNIASETFFPMESLAYGGLGNAWGAGCYIFSDSEFKKMGIEKNLFTESYQTIGDRIGISAGADDALKYTVEGLKNIQAPIQPEQSIQSVFNRYNKKKNSLNNRGFFAGIPAVATLTENKDERKKLSYSDMDFWHDKEQSVYRPWMTVDKLLSKHNFSIQERMLVVKFEEQSDLVKVTCRHTETNDEKVFWTRKLVMCSGVLGTARIVLRSFEQKKDLPLISNPYVYVPMLNWRRLGKPTEQLKSGMGQLVMFYDKKRDNSDVAMAALFTYRSLLLFRLIKEAPLNFAVGRSVMQYLVPAMVIAGIHHPENACNRKYLRLVADATSPTGDKLYAEYILNSIEQDEVLKTESEFYKTFFALGCIPIQKVYPGHGSSIHYAGTLPFSASEEIFTTAESGRLHLTNNVFVADGSSFQYLPAKGISFTLMANADRVARNSMAKTKASDSFQPIKFH